MSLIPDLSEIPELDVVAPGEYDLRVFNVKEIESKNTGRKAIMLSCEIVGEDNALPLFHSIWLPMASDDEDKKQLMLRMIKDFVINVGLPAEGNLEIEDFEDLQFSAFLDIEDNEYGKKNIIKRIS